LLRLVSSPSPYSTKYRRLFELEACLEYKKLATARSSSTPGQLDLDLDLGSTRGDILKSTNPRRKQAPFFNNE
jgi:hypothetical protein